MLTRQERQKSVPRLSLKKLSLIISLENHKKSKDLSRFYAPHSKKHSKKLKLNTRSAIESKFWILVQLSSDYKESDIPLVYKGVF